MMLRPLDSREGLTRYAITSIADLDFPALLTLMAEAWQADYTDHVRPDFTEAFLRRLMMGSTWVGVLVCTEAGQPVGFELALERTLYCRQAPLRTYYATVFTVSAHHRRRGIGRWLLEGINQLVFEEQQADLIFSTFHLGHAGSPTVQSTFDRMSDWGVHRFHTTPIWSRRLDREPLPLPEPIAVSRVVWPADRTTWTAQPDDHAAAAAIRLPTLDTFTHTIRTCYEVAFGLDASFRAQYLLPEAAEAETLWYDLGQDAACCVSFSITPLAVNNRRLRPVGAIQSLHTQACTPVHLEQVLRHLAQVFLAYGCFAMSLYDLGVMPHALLHRLGFHPSEDRYAYAVRGPRHIIEAFTTVHPPFFLDFT
jgi:GNAT superfamily N-acetyltransferase